jgi:hypothetical protein
MQLPRRTDSNKKGYRFLASVRRNVAARRYRHLQRLSQADSMKSLPRANWRPLPVVLIIVAICLENGCGSSSAVKTGVGGTGGNIPTSGDCDGGAPASLGCGADRCGNELVPECSDGRWVCPVVPNSASCSPDGEIVAPGVACGGGTCPKGMVCEMQSEEPSTWACAPFPPSCETDAGWLSTCGCINQQAQYLCPDGSPACTPLDGGFSVIGCTVSSIVPQ